MSPSGPGQSPLLLIDVVAHLDELGIAYAVIGALAASFHGVVRASLDADAVISTGGRTALVDNLISDLEAAGMEVSYRRGDRDDPVEGVIAITDRHANRVDLLTGLRGMERDFATRTIETSLLGASLRIVGLEDFIAMKAFAGGPQDLQDARSALRVSGDSVDLHLLRGLTARFGRDASEALETLWDEWCRTKHDAVAGEGPGPE